MVHSWQDTWVFSEEIKKGSQSVTQLVTGHDGNRTGFLKRLRSSKNEKARKRFRQEVVAYETLRPEGLPALLEHNSEDWEDKSIPLYMVLEQIAGVDLADYVAKNGPLPIDDAFVLVFALAGTLRRCHEDGVVHRDIKPANVMLRGGQPQDPVLVDFGLSFNEASAIEDVTEVGEEVGNRFLRLPEQPFTNRTAISDVTQLSAILLYALTSEEPRVLLDAFNNMPHQRDFSRDRLSNLFQGRQRIRLMSLFDRSFSVSSTSRFQSVDEFVISLEAVRRDDGDEGLDTLMAEMDERLARPRVMSEIDRKRRLGRFDRVVRESIYALSKGRGTQVTQTGAGSSGANAAVPFTETQMGIGIGGEPNLVKYRIELYGEEAVLSADGEMVWRGSECTDQHFRDAIITAAVKAFNVSE